MNTSQRNMMLSFLAAFAFLLWNYPLVTSVLDHSTIWTKMLYLFGTWLAIVYMTRKWTLKDKSQ